MKPDEVYRTAMFIVLKSQSKLKKIELTLSISSYILVCFTIGCVIFRPDIAIDNLFYFFTGIMVVVSLICSTIINFVRIKLLDVVHFLLYEIGKEKEKLETTYTK